GRSPSPRGDIQCCARHAQLPRPHGHSYAGTALARSRSSFSEPSKMDTNTQAQGFLVGIRQILIHGAITLLAIVIAFSLPPAARDACVLTLTGHGTFVDERSPVREVLRSAYEIRVMLVNPVGEGVRRRVESLPPEVTVLSFHGEIEASIAYLAELRKLGKKVTLKFYDEEPFWKIIVLGDHVWVQHCHRGCELNQQAEYVFALQHRDPRRGLFVPFYTYFLERWDEARHPEYDFESNQLVYRDAAGNETGRAPLGVPIAGAPRHSSIGTPARHGLATFNGHNQARLRANQ